jgi:hypothetical protein
VIRQKPWNNKNKTPFNGSSGGGLDMTKTSLSKLIELAKAVKMTPAQEEEQRRSFVFGNTAFENSQITRKMVDEVADALRA